MNAEHTAREGAGPGPRCRYAGVALLALLAAVATAPEAPAQQGWTDETFDLWLFQVDRTAAAVRTRLNSELSTRVRQIDRDCRLTDAQKQKLHLAGRGDIQRFFDRHEQAKERFRRAQGDQPMLRAALVAASPVQEALRDGLFHEESLLYKSLPRTLTDGQAAQLEAREAERRAARHRATIEQALAQIARGEPPLREAQRRDLIQLLAAEIKPPPKTAPPPFDLYYTLYMMGRLPEGRLKPLFGDAQWPVASRQINQIRQLAGELRQRGLLPDEDGDGGQAVPPPPALRKK